jgi:ethanolamine utilization cobalamin adenosyltransferase
MLGDKEYQFLKDLDKDDIRKYSDNYKRVLKHRILKKQHEVIECALLINKLRDKLETI